jgi:hypothetical protein
MKGSSIICCARGLLLCSLALGLLLGFTPLASAQNADQVVGNHLRAGEFGPAMAVARQQPGPARDRLFGQIAQAQARAGMRQAAFDTVGGINGRGAFGNSLSGVGGTQVGDGFGGGGGRGGGAEPDFESLIELITTTVKPDSWDDAGGPGTISEFYGGVRVDTKGLVHSLLKDDAGGLLAALRRRAGQVSANAEVRRPSLLRKVSLTRLERAVQLKLAAGLPLDEDMHFLAGLSKIQYVLIYPETGDIVLAGPAGDWKTDEEGRIVTVDSDKPVLRLDDFVVILRHMLREVGEPFGCSITPLKENLARTKALLDETSKKPLRAGKAAKDKYLADLRENLGQQAIEFYGVDPSTRVARVMFEADYRMKLVGIGKEVASHKVPSYLSMCKPNQPMDVMRWWFTLNYDAIVATQERNAFELRGQGVKVLSESELVDAEGNRLHTGKSDPLAADFAHNFTKHFDDLAAKYPIYAELRNIFDLALVCSLIQTHDLSGQAGWQMACFNNPQAYQVERGHAPKMVDSVINHRDFSKGQFVVVVSGGVRVDPASVTAKSAIRGDTTGTLSSRYHQVAPEKLPLSHWWWD